MAAGSELEDRRLAERMLAGDERAFAEFFDRHFPALYRFALARMARDADDAEEVAQAALCKAVAKLGTFRGDATLFTWLCTFCRHEISRFYASRERSPRTVGGLAGLEALAGPPGHGPGDELSRKETTGLVHAVLESLPAHYRDVLEWKYIDELPVQEIAERLGQGLKAAESLLTRARQAFRDAVDGG